MVTSFLHVFQAGSSDKLCEVCTPKQDLSLLAASKLLQLISLQHRGYTIKQVSHTNSLSAGNMSAISTKDTGML